MSNILKKNKMNMMKAHSKEQNIVLGEKLESLRNILILKAEDLATVLTISVNTIKNVEKGLNVGIEAQGELMFFYGFTLEELSSLKQLPTWKELVERIENFHKKHNSTAHNIVNKKPKLLELIEFRLIYTDVFDNWVNEIVIENLCIEEYGFEYKSILSTLNKSVEKGLLTSEGKGSDTKYKKNI